MSYHPRMRGALGGCHGYLRLHRRRRGLGRRRAGVTADRKSARRACCCSRPVALIISTRSFPSASACLIDNAAANWLYESEPEPGTANRKIPVPRGKMLGGSSAINGLVWVRGQPLDYDTWAQMGARGWSWQDVAPLFDRIENFEDARRRRAAAAMGRCRSPKCPIRTRSTTRCSRPAAEAGYQASIPTTTARTRKASSRRRPTSSAAGA